MTVIFINSSLLRLDNFMVWYGRGRKERAGLKFIGEEGEQKSWREAQEMIVWKIFVSFWLSNFTKLPPGY